MFKQRSAVPLSQIVPPRHTFVIFVLFHNQRNIFLSFLVRSKWIGIAISRTRWTDTNFSSNRVSLGKVISSKLIAESIQRCYERQPTWSEYSTCSLFKASIIKWKLTKRIWLNTYAVKYSPNKESPRTQYDNDSIWQREHRNLKMQTIHKHITKATQIYKSSNDGHRSVSNLWWPVEIRFSPPVLWD